MRSYGRRLGAVIAITAVCVVGLTGVGHAAGVITTPIDNPFQVAGDINGVPQSFKVVASGFMPGQNIFAEQCDGVPSTAPHWDPTVHCDNGGSNAPTIADGDGVATFNTPGPKEFDPIKGQMPSGVFACLAPNDPASDPQLPGGDWTNCQLRVSSNNAAVTGDQVFLTLTLPLTPGLADLVPPTINSFTPGEGSFVHGGTAEVTGDATDAGSGVASMTFTVDDGSTIAPIVDSTAPYGGTFDSTLLTDGDHTINVTATDGSDNTSEVETHHFTVDNTAPTIGVFTPAEGGFARGTSAAATGAATDDGSGVASMTFTVDDGSIIPPVVDSTAPFSAVFNSTSLTDGAHTINVTAADVLGNAAPTQTHNFTVDNAAPAQPHFTAALTPITGATAATVSFATTDATSGVKSYQVQVTKANFNSTTWGAWVVAPGASALTTTHYTFNGLAAGWDYCFRVIATDKAGNVSIASKNNCIARLIDDHAAVHSAGWVQGKSAAYYGATYSTARSANRTLTIAGFRGIRLAVKAVQCAACGAIRIYVGATLIRTVSLVSAATKNTIILLPPFSSRAGTIKIVTTSTRAVTIDGIGAGRT